MRPKDNGIIDSATVSSVVQSCVDVNLTIAQCVWGLTDEWTNSVDLRNKLNSICSHI